MIWGSLQGGFFRLFNFHGRKRDWEQERERERQTQRQRELSPQQNCELSNIYLHLSACSDELLVRSCFSLRHQWRKEKHWFQENKTTLTKLKRDWRWTQEWIPQEHLGTAAWRGVDNEIGGGLGMSAPEHTASAICFSLCSLASVPVICLILPNSPSSLPFSSHLFRYLASLLGDQYGLVLPVFSIKYLPLSS